MQEKNRNREINCQMNCKCNMNKYYKEMKLIKV